LLGVVGCGCAISITLVTLRIEKWAAESAGNGSCLVRGEAGAGRRREQEKITGEETEKIELFFAQLLD
jgi:hypothetical protein